MRRHLNEIRKEKRKWRNDLMPDAQGPFSKGKSFEAANCVLLIIVTFVARSSCIVLALEVPPTLKLILPPSTNSLKFIVESIRKISINDRLPRSRPLSRIRDTRQSPTPPQYVFWYHNNRMINYDTSRGSVTVQTDPGPTQSRLTIRQAVESDTGNYTCNASNTKPASIFVFVTEGDKMAAIQRRKTSAARKILNEMLLTAMLAASLVLAR
ncbi:hypothetical protein HZH68_003353 [Vespula germanica]|uniref:Ig-like domain-containing protein n=1 Tax=Vespula germanica TaxID=30212 RepID=A0A834NP41_VESGE|nr:hypothetical protein HZH68_003353 [Vespula germanica]